MSPRTLTSPLTFRRALKLAWATSLRISGALSFAKRQLARRNAIVVLTFHRVLEDSDFLATNSQPGILVRLQTFDALLRHIASRYGMIDLNHELDGAGVPGKRPRLCITFDDGWLDNYKSALAPLQSHRVPAMIFICPQLMNTQEPFWPESVVRFFHTQCGGDAAKAIAAVRAVLPDPPAFSNADELIEFLKTLPPTQRGLFLSSLAPAAQEAPAIDATISWEQVAEMARAGVAFGSHTDSHPILTRVPASDAARELSGSKEVIEARLSRPCTCLAYPNGNVNSVVRELASHAGYKLAFTTRPGAWTEESDPLRIPRINISENKLIGASGWFSATTFEYEVFWKAFRIGSSRPD